MGGCLGKDVHDGLRQLVQKKSHGYDVPPPMESTVLVPGTTERIHVPTLSQHVVQQRMIAMMVFFVHRISIKYSSGSIRCQTTSDGDMRDAMLDVINQGMQQSTMWIHERELNMQLRACIVDIMKEAKKARVDLAGRLYMLINDIVGQVVTQCGNLFFQWMQANIDLLKQQQQQTGGSGNRRSSTVRPRAHDGGVPVVNENLAAPDSAVASLVEGVAETPIVLQGEHASQNDEDVLQRSRHEGLVAPDSAVASFVEVEDVNDVDHEGLAAPDSAVASFADVEDVRDIRLQRVPYHDTDPTIIKCPGASERDFDTAYADRLALLGKFYEISMRQNMQMALQKLLSHVVNTSR